jgi:muramidase (phage lysozyme)
VFELFPTFVFRSTRTFVATTIFGGFLLCASGSSFPIQTATTETTNASSHGLSRASLIATIEDGPYEVTPERRALLNTIRYAEGTWKDGQDKGYSVIYGGGMVNDLSRHPERVVVKRYSSAAAGAYQFLPATWKGVARELELESFEPQHQDQAALHLAKRRGALKEIDQRGLTKIAMAKLAPEWASFPTSNGLSAYGQPVKSHQELASFYSKNLNRLKRQVNV